MSDGAGSSKGMLAAEVINDAADMPFKLRTRPLSARPVVPLVRWVGIDDPVLVLILLNQNRDRLPTTVISR